MTDNSDRPISNVHNRFFRVVGDKLKRKLKAQQNPAQGVWMGLGMMGIVGWSVVIPTLLGAALGNWIDNHRPGTYSWTLMLLVIGLLLGCFNAWHWMASQGKEMQAEWENDDA